MSRLIRGQRCTTILRALQTIANGSREARGRTNNVRGGILHTERLHLCRGPVGAHADKPFCRKGPNGTSPASILACKCELRTHSGDSSGSSWHCRVSHCSSYSPPLSKSTLASCCPTSSSTTRVSGPLRCTSITRSRGTVRAGLLTNARRERRLRLRIYGMPDSFKRSGGNQGREPTGAATSESDASGDMKRRTLKI